MASRVPSAEERKPLQTAPSLLVELREPRGAA
jgi:hypothetical protein